LNVNDYIKSGIIEAYVLGLCSTEEKLALEDLRMQHTEINNAILVFENELAAH
jgi:hypothetical protein